MLKLLHHSLKGIINKSGVRKVVYSPKNVIDDDYILYINNIVDEDELLGIKSIITSSLEIYEMYIDRINVVLFDYIDALEDNSIVKLDKDSLYILNRPSANSHSLFLTYNCNHFCLMCSEPPREEKDTYLIEDSLKVIELLDKDLPVLGISGGEPTLAGDNYIKIIKHIRQYLPDTYIRVLTNGRSYRNEKFVKKIAEIAEDYYISEIPIYSANYAKHDYVVQSKNAFYETIEGIYNCEKNNLYSEVRIVISKQNYQELSEIIDFIYRNLPFVSHIALMSLEYIGFAINNFDDIHISPLEYKEQLVEAIEMGKKYNLPISIYNLPLCLIDDSIKEYGRKTISDWKNEFSEECNDCMEKDNCSGMFSSTKPIYEKYIKKIQYSKV